MKELYSITTCPVIQVCLSGAKYGLDEVEQKSTFSEEFRARTSSTPVLGTKR